MLKHLFYVLMQI